MSKFYDALGFWKHLDWDSGSWDVGILEEGLDGKHLRHLS